MIWKSPLVRTLAVHCGVRATWRSIPITPNPIAFAPSISSSFMATRGLSSENRAVGTMDPHSFLTMTKNADERANMQIIDVREPVEIEAAKIVGDDIIYLPLSSADDWAPKVQTGKLLDSSKKTFCLCHHGVRSLRVANFLGALNKLKFTR
jgi:rhodanese-related sulfurtransferase